MNTAPLRRWLPTAALLPCLWLALYVVYWIDRVGCTRPIGECLAGAFGNWIGDVVMLQWVRSYQELIGGVAALLAAAAVVWTALQTRQNEIDDRLERESVALRLTVERLRRLWVRVGFLIDTGPHYGRIPAVIERIRAETENLPTSAYELAGAMTVCCDACDNYVEVILDEDEEDQDFVEDSKRELAIAAFAASAFFYGHQRLIRKQRYHHTRRVLDEDDIAEAAELGLRPDMDHPIAETLIEFPSSDASDVT